jgi:hypothetical protein
LWLFGAGFLVAVGLFVVLSLPWPGCCWWFDGLRCPCHQGITVK